MAASLQDPPPLILRVVYRLFEFQRHYENQVAPLLIQADIQIAHIDEMSALGRQDEETELKLFNQKQMLIRGASIQALSCVTEHASCPSCRAGTSHSHLWLNYPAAG